MRQCDHDFDLGALPNGRLRRDQNAVHADIFRQTAGLGRALSHLECYREAKVVAGFSTRDRGRRCEHELETKGENSRPKDYFGPL
jgi:hypothetical protein